MQKNNLELQKYCLKLLFTFFRRKKNYLRINQYFNYVDLTSSIQIKSLPPDVQNIKFNYNI